MTEGSIDFVVDDHGSIVILTPSTDEAKAWCNEHLPDDHMTFGQEGIVVEPRYIGAILDGAAEDGLNFIFA